MELTEALKIMENQKLMSMATYGEKYPDNSVVCFAYAEDAKLYFGSYSDTLKCKNIQHNPVVAVTIGTLQVHGEARVIPYGTEEYWRKRKVYDARFPQYRELFELEENELYEITPFVIWNYNPGKGGEMYRDCLILKEEYVRELDVYRPHDYLPRTK